MNDYLQMIGLYILLFSIFYRSIYYQYVTKVIFIKITSSSQINSKVMGDSVWNEKVVDSTDVCHFDDLPTKV